MNHEMTSKERVLAAISLQKTDRTPCALGLSYFVARHHHVPIVDIIKNPALFLKLKLKTFEELGGADLVNMAPPCLGNSPRQFFAMPVKVKMPGVDLPPDSIPQYDEMELMLAEDYPFVIEKGWNRFVTEVLVPRVFPHGAEEQAIPYDDAAWRKIFKDRNITFLPSNLVHPAFEVLSFARSFEKFFIDLYRRPDMVADALEVMTSEVLEAALDHIDEYTEAVMIPMNRESGGFLSPRFFETFAFPHLLRVVETMAARDLTMFFHLDQDWTKTLPYFKQFPAGRYLLHLDGMTDIFEAKRIVGDRMCLMGDVPARLLRLGTPKTVEAYCKRLVDEVGKGGGFVLGAG